MPCCIFPALLKHKSVSYEPFSSVCQTRFVHATPLTCSSEDLLCQYRGSSIIRVKFYCTTFPGFSCWFLQIILPPNQDKQKFRDMAHLSTFSRTGLPAAACSSLCVLFWGSCFFVLVWFEVTFLFCFLIKFYVDVLHSKHYWIAYLK